MSEPESQPVVEEGAAIFTCGNHSYTARDVIDAAFFRGDLEPAWNELLRCLECEAQSGDAEMEDFAIDAAVEKFRYDHDLITAEETEQWLEARGLTMDDFGNYFGRRYWGNTLRDKIQGPSTNYVSAPEEMRELLRAEAVPTGELDRMSMRLAWRTAGDQQAKEENVDLAAEREAFFTRAGIDQATLPAWLTGLGRDQHWLDEMVRLETIHNRIRGEILDATDTPTRDVHAALAADTVGGRDFGGGIEGRGQ